jgi:hypothetical protein
MKIVAAERSKENKKNELGVGRYNKKKISLVNHSQSANSNK